MGLERETKQTRKRKKRKNFSKGAAFEKKIAADCEAAGLEGPGRLPRYDWGQSQPDVLAWLLMLECKKREHWVSLGLMDWIDQAEGYRKLYDDVRYPVVVHDSTHPGRPADEIAILKWVDLLDIVVKAAKWDRHVKEINNMKQAVEVDNA